MTPQDFRTPFSAMDTLVYSSFLQTHMKVKVDTQTPQGLNTPFYLYSSNVRNTQIWTRYKMFTHISMPPSFSCFCLWSQLTSAVLTNLSLPLEFPSSSPTSLWFSDNFPLQNFAFCHFLKQGTELWKEVYEHKVSHITAITTKSLMLWNIWPHQFTDNNTNNHWMKAMFKIIYRKFSFRNVRTSRFWENNQVQEKESVISKAELLLLILEDIPWHEIQTLLETA